MKRIYPARKSGVAGNAGSGLAGRQLKSAADAGVAGKPDFAPIGNYVGRDVFHHISHLHRQLGSLTGPPHMAKSSCLHANPKRTAK